MDTTRFYFILSFQSTLVFSTTPFFVTLLLFPFLIFRLSFRFILLFPGHPYSLSLALRMWPPPHFFCHPVSLIFLYFSISFPSLPSLLSLLLPFFYSPFLHSPFLTFAILLLTLLFPFTLLSSYYSFTTITITPSFNFKQSRIPTYHLHL